MSKLIALIKQFKYVKLELALLSILAYTLMFSWKFAIILMVSVGFHEYGHVWAMKRMGIKTKGFYFVPLVGAVAVSQEEYLTYGENVFVAIMGPLWGALMSWMGAVMYYSTHNVFWAGFVFWCSFINLFNLLPVHPLDGGQIVRSITYSINKKTGLLTLIATTALFGILVWKARVFLLILVFAVSALMLFGEIRFHIQWWMYERTCRKNNREPASIETTYPQSMNCKQLLLAVVTYTATTASLLKVLFLMGKVHGFADAAIGLLKK